MNESQVEQGSELRLSQRKLLLLQFSLADNLLDLYKE